MLTICHNLPAEASLGVRSAMGDFRIDVGGKWGRGQHCIVVELTLDSQSTGKRNTPRMAEEGVCTPSRVCVLVEQHTVFIL